MLTNYSEDAMKELRDGVETVLEEVMERKILECKVSTLTPELTFRLSENQTAPTLLLGPGLDRIGDYALKQKGYLPYLEGNTGNSFLKGEIIPALLPRGWKFTIVTDPERESTSLMCDLAKQIGGSLIYWYEV